MNVLSLFDGMSCGQIALNKLGIEYDKYFASEIDKYAIQITKKNYPNTIHIGDVSKVDGKDLPKIDLLIGGSPCQGFSFSGKQLNFDDPRSKLFFEYERLLKETKPKYFLLENVNMKQEYQDIISNYLGVKPIRINSSLLSAARRDRLYWTNIPNIEQPKDKELTLKDVLDTNEENYVYWKDFQVEKLKKGEYIRKDYYRFEEEDKKVQCLMAQMGMNKPKMNYNGKIRLLTPIEWERIQNVPDNYTEGVSDSQRYKMLGNGWTVDVIAHILKNIKNN